MTTATVPCRLADPAAPANPGYRLKQGRIPDEYQWRSSQCGDALDPSLTGWWIEGFNLGDFDDTWPANLNSPDLEYGQVSEEQAKAWAARFIEHHAVFQVAGWTRTEAGDHVPDLTVTRHTLRIFALGDTTNEYWTFETLNVWDAQAIIGKLTDPDGVIELSHGDRVTYIPVRAVSSIGHTKTTEDVAR